MALIPGQEGVPVHDLVAPSDRIQFPTTLYPVLARRSLSEDEYGIYPTEPDPFGYSPSHPSYLSTQSDPNFWRVTFGNRIPLQFEASLTAVADQIIAGLGGTDPYIAWFDGTNRFMGYSIIIGTETYREFAMKGAKSRNNLNPTESFGVGFDLPSYGVLSGYDAGFSVIVTGDNTRRNGFRFSLIDGVFSIGGRYAADQRGHLYEIRGHPETQIATARLANARSCYIITNPGGTDSDGVVQRNPLMDGEADRLVNYPPAPEKHEGTADILAMQYSPLLAPAFLSLAQTGSRTSIRTDESPPQLTLDLLLYGMDADALATRGALVLDGHNWLINDMEIVDEYGTISSSVYRLLNQ